MKKNRYNFLYLFLILIIYLSLTSVIVFGKRTSYSNYESRNTALMNDVNLFNFPNQFTEFFNDSIPYKDNLVNLAIYIKSYLKLNRKDNFTINEYNKENFNLELSGKTINNNINDLNDIVTETNNINNDSVEEFDYKVSTNGATKLVTIGEGDNFRGMFLFDYKALNNFRYMNVINTLKKSLNELNLNNITINSILVPMHCSLYLPKDISMKLLKVDQHEYINSCYDKLIDGIDSIDAYEVLERHVNDDIFFRTDTHWTQLGAHYVAEEYVKKLNLSFKDLSEYEKVTLNDYVGSLFRYSENFMFMANSEDFTYYKPINITYDTIQQQYVFDNNHNFSHLKIVNTNVFNEDIKEKTNYYDIFFGGDSNTTVIRTNNGNNRRVLVLKDSFGNSFVPNLINSFNEIHVIDYRYFYDNLIDYIKTNDITDIVFVSNISLINSEAEKYEIMLIQQNYNENLIIK